MEAVLPTKLNSDIQNEIRDSKSLKDDLEDWLDDEEAGIITKCDATYGKPIIYLKMIDYSIDTIDYVGISSFSSYSFSENYLNEAKIINIINKKTLHWEDFGGEYSNPLLNKKKKNKEIEKHLASVL